MVTTEEIKNYISDKAATHYRIGTSAGASHRTRAKQLAACNALTDLLGWIRSNDK